MELYIGLSKNTEITITLNQIYHFHRLIMKYKQELVSHLSSEPFYISYVVIVYKAIRSDLVVDCALWSVVNI